MLLNFEIQYLEVPEEVEPHIQRIRRIKTRLPKPAMPKRLQNWRLSSLRSNLSKFCDFWQKAAILHTWYRFYLVLWSIKEKSLLGVHCRIASVTSINLSLYSIAFTNLWMKYLLPNLSKLLVLFQPAKHSTLFFSAHLWFTPTPNLSWLGNLKSGLFNSFSTNNSAQSLLLG